MDHFINLIMYFKLLPDFKHGKDLMRIQLHGLTSITSIHPSFIHPLQEETSITFIGFPAVVVVT